MKKTPLYESHVELGAKMTDFGGWALPIQYSSILKEHHAVRKAAGLFDVSHMGEISIEGKGAGEYIQGMVTNDISNIAKGRVVYSPMCYEDGGTVDDLLIYKLRDDKYLLVVNASNTHKDYLWLKDNCQDHSLLIEDVSKDYALLAIQGPASADILQKLTPTSLKDIKFFRFLQDVEVAGAKALVSRTGYTGEDGFEIYIPSKNAADLWKEILSAGKEDGLVPAGLGARDTLRFEVALPLYGHELSPEISPLEAGLDKFVKLYQDEFMGKDALEEEALEGSSRKTVGFEMIDRGMPRNGYTVRSENKEIGYVTSGGMAPSLKKNMGLALVDSKEANLHDEIYMEVRGKSLKAKVVKVPFYVKQYSK